MPEIGDFIKFKDEHGVEHNALVQFVHVFQTPDGLVPKDPTINLIHLSHDPAKNDTYGRQSEKRTSVQHKNRTTANGFYWEEI